MKKVYKKLKENYDEQGMSIQDVLVKQIHQEYNNFLFYIKLSSCLNSIGLQGLASWYVKQATEEISHGNKIVSFLQSQGYDYDIHNCNTLTDFLDIDLDSVNVFDVAMTSLNREKTNTNKLYCILEFCISKKLGIEEQFIREMIKEQEEEVDKFQTLIDKLKVNNNNTAGLLLIDKEYN